MGDFRQPTLNTGANKILVEQDSASKLPSRNVTRRAQLLRLAGLVVLLALLISFGRTFFVHIPNLTSWIDNLGYLGPLIFTLGYIFAVVAFIPGSVLSLVAGALFGLFKGAICVFIAALIGSTISFLVSRYLAGDFMKRIISHNARFEMIDRGVRDDGRKIVFLLRLTPLVPFNILNYALGLTRVRLVDYVLASIGMIPGTLFWVYSGKVAGTVLSAAKSTDGGRSGEYALLILGLIAAITVSVLITRIARRALVEADTEGTCL